MIEVATIGVLAVPPNLVSFIRAQTAFASSHLPLVVTFALAVLIIPGPEGDVHFGANGHRLYAAWLLPRLRSRLALSAKPAGPRPAPE